MFRLPLPNQGFKSLAEGSENLLQQILQKRKNADESRYRAEHLNIEKTKLPYAISLLQAQSQDAQAKAIKNQLIGNALNAALGGSQESGFQGLPSQGAIDQTGSVEGIPTQGIGNQSKQSAKSILQALGVLKETPEEQQQREISTEWSKNIQDVDKKQVQGWNDSLNENIEMVPVLERNQELLANPKLKDIYKHPEFLGYDIEFLKRYSKDPEVSRMLTELGANTKTLYQSIVSGFKGAARKFEFNLIDKMAPNETKDTYPMLVAKTNAMLSIRELLSNRIKMAQKIWRDSQGKISPNEAMEKANQLIKGKETFKKIEENFKAEELKQRDLVYDRMAQEAIANGADPIKVQQKLKELRSKNG